MNSVLAPDRYARNGTLCRTEAPARPPECFSGMVWHAESRHLPKQAAKHRTGLLFAILAVVAIHAGIADLIARLTHNTVDHTLPRVPLRVGLVASKPAAPAPTMPPPPQPAAHKAPPPPQKHTVMSTAALSERSIPLTPAVTPPALEPPVQANQQPEPDTHAKQDTTAPAAANTTIAPPGDAPKPVQHADCNVQPPEYPLAARRLNEHGRVMIRLSIDEYGHVVKADIEHSSGFALLDEAARKAALAAPCHPYREGTRAMAVSALQPFDFVPAR